MWPQLIFAFFRVSMLGFGGGPSSIPLMHKEVVERYKWLEDDEFSEILAIGNMLPGPILTKMAGYIGYRLKGVPGAAAALLITTIPTVIGMILIFALLGSLQGLGRVEGMTYAIQPVVGVMLAVLAYGFLAANRKKLGYIISLALAGCCFALMAWLQLHPALLIVILLAAGFGYSKPLKKKKRDEREGTA